MSVLFRVCMCFLIREKLRAAYRSRVTNPKEGERREEGGKKKRKSGPRSFERAKSTAFTQFVAS